MAKEWKEVPQYSHFPGEVKVFTPDSIPADVQEVIVAAPALGFSLLGKSSAPTLIAIGVAVPTPLVVILRMLEEDRVLPPFLQDVLKSEKPKVVSGNFGARTDDVAKLEAFNLRQEDYNGFLGLAGLAEKKGVNERGLVAIAKVFNLSLKRDRAVATSDWVAEELSAAQKEFAADDAYFALKCYEELMSYTPPKAKPSFIKIADITPDGKGVNVLLKCVKVPEAVDGPGGLKEAVCGDETGIVTVSFRGDETIAMCQAGASLRLQNAHVRMIKGRIRLVADKWAAFKAADAPHAFEANELNDISATEYELVVE